MDQMVDQVGMMVVSRFAVVWDMAFGTVKQGMLWPMALTTGKAIFSDVKQMQIA
jgi:hypothetical protein